MSATQSQRDDVLNKARNRTLASNDPGWVAVKTGWYARIPADVTTYNDVLELGGPVEGADVNKVC